MSAEEEMASPIQQQETATKALTFFPAPYSLPVSPEVMKGLRKPKVRYLSYAPPNSAVFYTKYWKSEMETEKPFVLYYLSESWDAKGGRV